MITRAKKSETFLAQLFNRENEKYTELFLNSLRQRGFAIVKQANSPQDHPMDTFAAGVRMAKVCRSFEHIFWVCVDGHYIVGCATSDDGFSEQMESIRDFIQTSNI